MMAEICSGRSDGSSQDILGIGYRVEKSGGDGDVSSTASWIWRGKRFVQFYLLFASESFCEERWLEAD